jgi:hypothetical protein
MRAAVRAGLVTTVLALAGLCPWVAPSPAAAETCPNEAIRAEQRADALPECRAYELVTPGALLGSDGRPAMAAAQGGAITYYSTRPNAASTTSSYFFRAVRGAADWTYESIGAQDTGGTRFEGQCEQNVFFAPDLSTYILEAGWNVAGEPARCKRPAPIVAGEPDPFRNVFLPAAGGGYQLLNLTPPTATPENARFQAGSRDFSRIVFGEEAQLTPDAPAGYDFYVWSGGALHLLTVLPDGTPTSGELVEALGHGSVGGTGFAPFTGALSEDGRRAFFYAGTSLYLRENPEEPQSAVAGGQCTEPARACTIQIDASHGPGPSGGGVFWWATPTGSTVFFTDANRLTADSTAEPGKPDLYRFDVESGQLTDLTAHPGEAANVLGVAGIGADGTTVYFVANGALASGAAPGGTCPGTWEAPGTCNLYALVDGTTRFIGTLGGNEYGVWDGTREPSSPRQKAGWLTSTVSPNGRYLAFVSRRRLTAFDNMNPRWEEPDAEIYLYDAAGEGGAGALSCATCPSVGPANEPGMSLATAGNYGPYGASWKTRSLLDDGSLFFNSRASLIPADENKREDVYRYRGGELTLVSPGDTEDPAHFLDAGPDGTDIYFRTSQPLVGRDRDEGNFSLYDARVGGGFPEPAPTTPCEEETCRPPAGAAPPAMTPGVPAAEEAAPPAKKAKKKAACRKARKAADRRKRGGARKRPTSRCTAQRGHKKHRPHHAHHRAGRTR